MTADFPDWTTPQAHANAISTTGAPPLVFKQVLDQQSAVTIPANGTLTRPASGQLSLNQPGYEISISVGAVSGAALPLTVELQWYDSTTGLLMDDETYYFYGGDINGHQVHGRGPTKGDRLVVVVSNRSSTNAVSFTYALLQTSRVYTREFWKTITKAGAFPVFPGLTAITHNITGNVIGVFSASVPASTTINRVLPLYTGTARLMGSGANSAGMTQWTVQSSSDPLASSESPFQGVNGQSGFSPDGVTSLYVADLALPRSQCQLAITNSLTVAQIVIMEIMAQEDRA